LALPGDRPKATTPEDSATAEPPPENGAKEDFRYPRSESVGYLVRDCYRCLARILAGYIASSGVKMGQWYFLRELREEDGLTQRELSQRVGRMEPATVVAIRGMAASGPVSRVRDKDDRRKIRIYLTRKARRLKNKLLPLAAAVNIKATKGLSQREILQFRDIIGRIMRNIS